MDQNNPQDPQNQTPTPAPAAEATPTPAPEAPAAPAPEKPAEPTEPAATPAPEAPAAPEPPAEPAATPEAAPAAEEPAPVAVPPAPAAEAGAPAAAPAEGQAEPAVPPAPAIQIDDAEWEAQKKDLGKHFVKTFSPRMFNIPFSYHVDKDRAQKAAKAKGLTVPENPMILTTGNMFWGSLLLEVTGENTAEDQSLEHLTEVYTKVSTESGSKLQKAAESASYELGSKPKATYIWQAEPAKAVIIVQHV